MSFKYYALTYTQGARGDLVMGPVLMRSRDQHTFYWPNGQGRMTLAAGAFTIEAEYGEDYETAMQQFCYAYCPTPVAPVRDAAFISPDGKFFPAQTHEHYLSGELLARGFDIGTTEDDLIRAGWIALHYPGNCEYDEERGMTRAQQAVLIQLRDASDDEDFIYTIDVTLAILEK